MPVIINSEYQVSIWRPNGLITLKLLVEELVAFSALEKTHAKFNRFADLSKCDFSLIKYDDIKQIYLMRKSVYTGPPVRSVFFIKTDLQYGITRIYQTLMEDTLINVDVFKTKQECADLLQIPLEILFA